MNNGLNTLNELTNLTRSGTFTVAGTTSSGATNVTVNTLNAHNQSRWKPNYCLP